MDSNFIQSVAQLYGFSIGFVFVFGLFTVTIAEGVALIRG